MPSASKSPGIFFAGFQRSPWRLVSLHILHTICHRELRHFLQPSHTKDYRCYAVLWWSLVPALKSAWSIVESTIFPRQRWNTLKGMLRDSLTRSTSIEMMSSSAQMDSEPINRKWSANCLEVTFLYPKHITDAADLRKAGSSRQQVYLHHRTIWS